ncbi:cell division protein FtsA [Psychromonas ingrahamii 37]|uniref:Cell division protein FtsA n=1 Tax=Psychromonas ingrahamii (strain DSM 17664 / CCUG 51855 / 37) TaxID=357804 RepID=A1SU23_PSYIN|nr:cell division protein FtsA [Psychromonas ingrahamii]ABM02988.1 cell division protein FtsA [Psychromonas ingrahamii 37]
MESNYTVGLDIGSSKIVLLIGEQMANNMINIVGIGEVPAKGVDKGSVTDLDSVVTAIQNALTVAEEMANCKVSSVNLSVSGAHIESTNESGTWAIDDNAVSSYDIESVLHNAQSIKIRDDQRLLHVIPQQYSIDSQEGISNPLGLAGVKLKADVHLITCHNDFVKNLEKAVELCGLLIEQLTFSGVASSAAILSEDEKELGVCIVDIGSGTMDISVYIAGALRHSSVLAYAGNSVSNDIAITFSSPQSSAEKIKIKYGCLQRDSIDPDEMIELTSVGGRNARTLQRQMLVDVIEARYSELLELIKKELCKLSSGSGMEGLKQKLAAGIVITGGAAQMVGLVEVAEKVFDNMQVRIGKPENLQGLVDDVATPAYSTVLGLLRFKTTPFSKNDESPDVSGFSVIISRIRSRFSVIINRIKKEY